MKAGLLIFLLSSQVFSQNENSSINSLLNHAIETTDTEKTLNEYFIKYPDLLDHAERYREYVSGIEQGQKIQNNSKKASVFLEPLVKIAHDKVPVIGTVMSNVIELMGKIIGIGGFITGKSLEIFSRYELSNLNVLATDEILTRALIDTFYGDILPVAKSIDNITTERKSFFGNMFGYDTKKSIFDNMSALINSRLLSNTLDDLTDKVYITDKKSERSQELARMQSRLKLGKLKFEYYIRLLQIKAIERVLVEKQSYRTWLKQSAEQPNIAILNEDIANLKQEIKNKNIQIVEEENVDKKQLLMNEVEELNTQMSSKVEQSEQAEKHQIYVEILQEHGITREMLSQDIKSLKAEALILIKMNDKIHEDIFSAQKDHQLEDLMNRVKAVENKLNNK